MGEARFKPMDRAKEVVGRQGFEPWTRGLKVRYTLPIARSTVRCPTFGKQKL